MAYCTYREGISRELFIWKDAGKLKERKSFVVLFDWGPISLRMSRKFQLGINKLSTKWHTTTCNIPHACTEVTRKEKCQLDAERKIWKLVYEYERGRHKEVDSCKKS